jgi:hypothetical protein
MDEDRRHDPDAGRTDSTTDENRDEYYSEREREVERAGLIENGAPLVTATVPVR